MLHFFPKTSSAGCSSAGASRDQVTSAVVNSGSTLRLSCLLRSVLRSGRPRLPLVSPCPVLEDSALCSLSGSSAVSPGARRRRPPRHRRVRLSVIWSTETLRLCFVRSDSCQEGDHMTRKIDNISDNPSENNHIISVSISLFTGELWLVCRKLTNFWAVLVLYFPALCPLPVI